MAAEDPPVGQQHVAGREIQGLSSVLTVEKESKEAASDTEFEEIAPSGADSRGATATAVGSPNLTHVSLCACMANSFKLSLNNAN